MSEREELLAERAELMAKNAAATSWGAALGARHERIKGIDRALQRIDESGAHAQGRVTSPQRDELADALAELLPNAPHDHPYALTLTNAQIEMIVASLRAPEAADAGAAAVYQIMATDDDPNSKDVWMDVPKEAFSDISKRPDMRGRVLYASAPSSTDGKGGA